MMSTVTPLIRSIDREIIKKLFQKFSAVYGTLWNGRCGTADEWYECAGVWLEGLKGFDLDVLKKSVAQAFIAHKSYPPTLGQLVEICLHVSGVPSESQIIEAMVRRDFNHPMIKVIYDGIGSWALSHDKPDEIKRKVKAMYAPSLDAYRTNPDKAWKALEEYRALPAPAELPSKIPSRQEIIGWRERFEKYKVMSAEAKAELKPVDHPVWDKGQIMIGHPNFDLNVYKERKAYLLGLDETVAMSLSTDDQYDRIRFLREELAAMHVKSIQDGTYVPPKEKTSPRRSNGATTIYKHWMGD